MLISAIIYTNNISECLNIHAVSPIVVYKQRPLSAEEGRDSLRLSVKLIA
jgi:hypothetical protein